MAKRIIKRATRARSSNSTIQSTDPTTWPVIWRVVAPCSASYDNDMTFLETESEADARAQHAALRKAKWPVRLERVQCGPLPTKANQSLANIRAGHPQNPGTTMRPVLGLWTAGDAS